MGSPSVELSSVRSRLRRKKVFIVLDDVNHFKQLDTLVGDLDRFGDGSRIIVTTRDKQVLSTVTDKIYNVQGLNFDEAYKLFCSKAFKEKSSISDDYSILSERVIYYAQGVPLALTVLGSFLHSKSKEEWESALEKLKIVPNMDIQHVLRISYDGLDDNEKDIFLDIACFFTGHQSPAFIESMLDACGFFTRIGLRILHDKSLIYISGYNLWMHDLLREMGRQVVREQSIKEPGKRSRLWNIKDVYHVLKRNSGTATVEGIFLHNSETTIEVNLSPEVFSEMHSLRLLKIYGIDKKDKCNLNFPQGLQYLPDALTYLYWNGCSLKSLPSNFTPENIVILEMRYSQLEQLWDGIQHLGKLRKMDLSYSRHLIQIPDLSHASNLETLNLKYCTSLLKLPSSFQYNDKLSSLNLKCCSKLEKLPELSKNIKDLVLKGCTALKELPSSIGYLGKLDALELQNCKALTNLPSSIGNLTSLEFLNLSGCTSFNMFPSLPRFISWLDLSGTAIKAVPSSIDLLSGLHACLLEDCTKLESLPTSICDLKSLSYLYLSGCSKLEYFPEILEPMECLHFLRLDNSGIKELHSSIGNLSGLNELNLEMCKNLKVLPDSIHKLSSLEYLHFFGCSNLEKFPPLPSSSWQTLTQGGHICQVSKQHLTFLNCLNLDQEACSVIMADAETRVLRMATLSAENQPFIRISCPGDEIPDWFTYRTNGSSINIQLPLNWYDTNFLGLALCAVVAFQDYGVEQGLPISCECLLKKTNYRYQKFTWSMDGWARNSNRTGIVNSDHIFVWYNHKTFQNFNAKEAKYWSSFCSASFDFSPRSDGCTIKKCGISLLYAQDAESFDIIVAKRRWMS